MRPDWDPDCVLISVPIDVQIPCVPPESNAPVEIALGSADAADKERNVIKGGKGAMLREKLVRECASQYVVLIDEKKLVDRAPHPNPNPNPGPEP